MADKKAGFTLILSSLASRRIRQTATGGAIVRAWDASSGLTSASGQGWLERLGNFIFGAIGNLSGLIVFSARQVWTWITSATRFIWNFDWNISDKAIDKQIKNSFDSFGSILGGGLGQIMGWVTCGILPAAAIFTFNEAMGAHVLKEVGEEAIDEIVGAASTIINGAFRLTMQAGFMWLYKGSRSIIKFLAIPALKKSNPALAEKIERWGREGSETWSFAKKWEKTEEKIPAGFLRNFTSSFFEEAGESCVEAGYVVAGAVDSWMAMERLSGPALGPQRAVEIVPDRTVPSERVVFTGPQQLVQQTILNTMANHQLLENRDVGQVIGVGWDTVRAMPQTLKLIIIFYNRPTPPYTNKAGLPKISKAEYQISDIKMSKCSWDVIKRACGGKKGFMGGPIKATAKLTNGRQMQIYASTENEAEALLKSLIELSEAEIIYPITFSTQKGQAKNPKGKPKKPVQRMYPAFATIINQRKLANADALDDRQPVQTLTGRYERLRARVQLWPEVEPPVAKSIIQEMLTTKA